jgi:hypothetical protein
MIRRLGPTEIFVCLEAALVLTVAHCALNAVPFRRLARTLGKPGMAAGPPLAADQQAAVQRITWLGGAVARRHPLRPQCLAHSIAAKWMLWWRGIPCTLYIGMREDGTGEGGEKSLSARTFVAHAWVHADGKAVAGGRDNMHQHAILGTYS